MTSNNGVSPPPKHSFLIGGDGGLSIGAKAIPAVRDHIESLPKTASTFKSKDVDFSGHFPDLHDGNRGNVRAVHYEFAGAWQLPLRFDAANGNSRNKTTYVNPDGVHANHYADVAAQCNCGAWVNRWYEDGVFSDGAYEHEDDCLPYHRMRARAGLGQVRHRLGVRLGRMGWRGPDLASRFGVSKNAVGPMMRDFGETLTGLHDEYRTMAAATYVHLTRENNVPAEDVAKVYGVRVGSIGRWVRDFLNYETETGKMFARDVEGGGFRWIDVSNPASDRYGWLSTSLGDD